MPKKEDKIADPVNHYKRPSDVEHDDDLTRDEKITLLENWLDDIKLREIAEAENMPGTEDSRTYIGEVESMLNRYKHG